MLLAWLLLSILTTTFARPNNFGAKNVITVPPNCPVGQEWINGQCRDIWFRSFSTPAVSIYAEAEGDENSVVNVVDQNENLPIPKNIISVPTQCPDGYKPDALGVCRKVLDFALI